MSIHSLHSEFDYDVFHNSYRVDNIFKVTPVDGDEFNSSQDVLTDEYSWRIIREISDSREHAAEILQDEALENLKNQYNGVMVKVDGVIHRLNPLQLALNSDYFEKLLTGDFNERKSQLVELHSIDGHVFSYIIELINGKKLTSVINTDNYVELLMAMDYLQMEIDLKTFCDIIIDNLKVPLKQNSSIFKLHDFVALQDKKFEYLLRVVRGYLSIHLNELYDCDEYLSLSADQLVKIIARNELPEYTREKNQIGRICAKWICHDIENRFSHIVDLVNAARYRYDIYYEVHPQNVKFPFSSSGCKAETKLALVEKHFNRLLNLDGEIDPAVEEFEELESENKTNDVVNKMDKKKKLTEFFENEYFYDVTVKAGGKIFKLHRFVLASSSDYFLQIFTAEISRAAQSANPSNFLADIDAEYLLEEIDSVTFSLLIKFLYFGETNLSSCSNLEIVRLLKAAIILKSNKVIADIKHHIFFWLKKFQEHFIELLNFTYGDEIHEEFHTTLCKLILTTWPEIVNTPQFYSASFDVLENILTSGDLTLGEQEILDICSKWIAHDVKNRFSFLTRISVVINRNYMMDEAFEVEIPKDWNSLSEQFFKDRLWEILCSNTLVPSKTNIENGGLFGKPMFVAVEGERLHILDADLEKIASIRSPECPFSFFQKTPYPPTRGQPRVNRPIDDKFQTSATIIDNNLFIVYVTEKKSYFQVYNLYSKKLIALASDQRMHLSRKITLLNCKNQVYCCFEDGLILKYVVELNRWTTFSEGRLNANIQFVFASNGHTLFKVPWSINSNNPEIYNFEQNSWITLPSLPPQPVIFYSHRISATTFNSKLAILFPNAILLFDNQPRPRNRISIPFDSAYRFEIFTQYEEGILYMRNRKSYCISTSGLQILHKDLSDYSDCSQFVTIHNVCN